MDKLTFYIGRGRAGEGSTERETERGVCGLGSLNIFNKFNVYNSTEANENQ